MECNIHRLDALHAFFSTTSGVEGSESSLDSTLFPTEDLIQRCPYRALLAALSILPSCIVAGTEYSVPYNSMESQRFPAKGTQFIESPKLSPCVAWAAKKAQVIGANAVAPFLTSSLSTVCCRHRLAGWSNLPSCFVAPVQYSIQALRSRCLPTKGIQFIESPKLARVGWAAKEAQAVWSS
jgi:hypothetical protein